MGALFVVIALLLPSALAQSSVVVTAEVKITKIFKYRQVGAEGFRAERPRFEVRALVRGGTTYTSLRFVAPGLTLPLVVQPGNYGGTTYLATREFDDIAALTKAVPNGLGTIFVNDVWKIVTVTGQSDVPAPRIENFDSLQSWEGGRLDVEFTGVPDYIPTPVVGLVLKRANGQVIYPPPDPSWWVPWEAPVALQSPVKISGLTTAAGESLTGVLTLDQPATFIGIAPPPPIWGAAGPVSITAIGTYAVELEFPITRSGLPPPLITVPPQSRSVLAGQPAVLSVTATSATSYQWSRDGKIIPGATAATFTIPAAQPADAGDYAVVVTNASGSVTSAIARLTVTAAATPPQITAQPAALAVTNGAPARLSVSASGSDVTYQWFRDGAAIAGATNATLEITRARFGDSGAYTVAVTNAAGTVTSASVPLNVNAVTRLSNLSIRTRIEGGGAVLTIGLTLRGAGEAPAKPLLLRAAGPTLTAFGVGDALSDPRLALLSGADVIAQNDQWAGNAQVDATCRAVGAFGFASTASRDAALVHGVAPGGYTVQITAAGGETGQVLAEVYDATGAEEFAEATPRLVNLSALAPVGTGGDILIAGFSIAGAAPKTILVRAVGPSLAGFGVGGVLEDPKLEVFENGVDAALARNDDWSTESNAAQLAGRAAGIGAFALPVHSKDAALLITLPPGSYTAQVSGVGDTTGTALVEVYELD